MTNFSEAASAGKTYVTRTPTAAASPPLIYVIWSHYYKLQSDDGEKCQTAEMKAEMEVRKKPIEAVFYEERNERSSEEIIYI